MFRKLAKPTAPGKPGLLAGSPTLNLLWSVIKLPVWALLWALLCAFRAVHLFVQFLNQVVLWSMVLVLGMIIAWLDRVRISMVNHPYSPWKWADLDLNATAEHLRDLVVGLGKVIFMRGASATGGDALNATVVPDAAPVVLAPEPLNATAGGWPLWWPSASNSSGVPDAYAVFQTALPPPAEVPAPPPAEVPAPVYAPPPAPEVFLPAADVPRGAMSLDDSTKACFVTVGVVVVCVVFRLLCVWLPKLYDAYKAKRFVCYNVPGSSVFHTKENCPYRTPNAMKCSNPPPGSRECKFCEKM
jgi:hypothetical protein